ncbi:type 2 periplasmic-binding domain-containing protein [Noviherbaspirillum galbum]|uniref:Response regulatory domain-containing protein n=1 Tax=Noviherbaspirillum galbum TaxID=2709383 RepID=A0A6B3SQF9_9BURK|nr:hypothetical protein [Noviherbaspirillum galbum]NEX62997.1 hypothetical protein [Noviherbaspirillum galbum]
MNRKNILVAANPAVRDMFLAVLEPLNASTTFCHTVEDAESFLLAGECDLIICTLQFDESRWAELLQFVRATPSCSLTPFLVLKVSQGLLTESLIEASLKSAKLIGASETVNFPAWRRELGDAEAVQALRDLIHSLL